MIEPVEALADGIRTANRARDRPRLISHTRAAIALAGGLLDTLSFASLAAAQQGGSGGTGAIGDGGNAANGGDGGASRQVSL